MTGKKAGAIQKNGRYPVNTVHGLVQKRLEEMTEMFDGAEAEVRKELRPERKGYPKPPGPPKAKRKK